MADLGETFNPNDVPADDRSFDPIPAGDYLCQITDSDVVETKAGNGQILKLTLEVMEGPYESRKVFENLNIRNPNPQAQSIAQRALADLCQAVGVGAIRDSEDLHFRPFVARIAIEHDKSGQYEPKNRVKKYRPAQGAPPAAKAAPARPTHHGAAAPSAANAPPPATTAPSRSSGNRPWNRPAA